MKRVFIYLLLLFSLMTIQKFAYSQNESPTENRGVKINNANTTGKIWKGKTFAVVVGVSNYKHLHALKYADNDAMLFREFLLSKAGGTVKEDDILLLTNDSAKSNSFLTIKKWVKNLKNLENGDRIIFYFAGHADALSKNEYYFLLPNCDPAGDADNYQGPAHADVIEMANLKDFFSSYILQKGVSVLLVWDACRTNENPGGKNGLKDVQTGIAEKSEGENILLSASEGQTAIEDKNYADGHGLFTYYLIEGLTGAGGKVDKNGDGIINIKELKNWIDYNIQNDSFKLAIKHEQDPQIIIKQPDMPMAYTDNEFNKKWVKLKVHSSPIEGYALRGTAKRSVQNEKDKVPTELYNKFLEAIKNNNFSGKECAEDYLKILCSKYPQHDYIKEARFILITTYSEIAQDKINNYLLGKDDALILKSLNKTDNTKSSVFDKIPVSSGVSYYICAQYAKRAYELLKEDDEDDKAYLNNLKNRANFLLGYSYCLGENKLVTYSNALAHARLAMNAMPDAACNNHLMGLLLQSNHQLDSAAYYERRAVLFAPKWIYPLLGMGVNFYNQKKYDSAEWYYNQALLVRPEYDLALNAMGCNLDAKGKYQEARIYFRKAIAVNPDLLYAYNSMGNSFKANHQYDSASYYYRQTITIDPTFSIAYNNLGVNFKDQEIFDSALIYYKKAIALDTGYVTALSNAGVIYNEWKKTDSAEIYYKKALSIDLDFDFALNNLGKNYSDKGNPDTAEYYFKRAITIDHRYRDALINLASIYQDKKLYDSAIFYLQIILKYYINDTATLSGMAEMYTAKNDIKTAIKYLEKAIINGIQKQTIEVDHDLDGIKNTKLYKDLMKKYFSVN